MKEQCCVLLKVVPVWKSVPSEWVKQFKFWVSEENKILILKILILKLEKGLKSAV